VISCLVVVCFHLRFLERELKALKKAAAWAVRAESLVIEQKKAKKKKKENTKLEVVRVLEKSAKYSRRAKKLEKRIDALTEKQHK
jgi:hypothetical protein